MVWPCRVQWQPCHQYLLKALNSLLGTRPVLNFFTFFPPGAPESPLVTGSTSFYHLAMFSVLRCGSVAFLVFFLHSLLLPLPLDALPLQARQANSPSRTVTTVQTTDTYVSMLG